MKTYDNEKVHNYINKLALLGKKNIFNFKVNDDIISITGFNDNANVVHKEFMTYEFMDKQLIIPNFVTRIEAGAFNDVEMTLEFLQMNNVEYIGDDAFNKRTYAEEVRTKHKGVNIIKEYTEELHKHGKENYLIFGFGNDVITVVGLREQINGCEVDYNGKDIIIPSFTDTIGRFALGYEKYDVLNLLDLSNVVCFEANAIGGISAKKLLFNKHIKCIGIYAFASTNFKDIDEFRLDMQIDIIDEGAFSNCNPGKHLFIGDKIGSVKRNSFAFRAEELETLEIVGDSCIEGLGNLFLIGDKIKSIKVTEAVMEKLVSIKIQWYLCSTDFDRDKNALIYNIGCEVFGENVINGEFGRVYGKSRRDTFLDMKTMLQAYEVGTGRKYVESEKYIDFAIKDIILSILIINSEEQIIVKIINEKIDAGYMRHILRNDASIVINELVEIALNRIDYYSTLDLKVILKYGIAEGRLYEGILKRKIIEILDETA